MYFLPSHRGKGLMNTLLQEAKNVAMTEDAIKLRLYVYRNNKRAIKEYQNSGFSDSDYDIIIMLLGEVQPKTKSNTGVRLSPHRLRIALVCAQHLRLALSADF
jgi:hypothetical protein